MIKEDYVSFKISKLLNEKGFDIPCREHYYQDGSLSPYSTEYNNWNGEENYYSCPTLQMTMKWLREKHHIVIDVCLEDYITEVDGSLTITYTYTIWYFNRHLSHTGETDIRYTDAAVDGEEKTPMKKPLKQLLSIVLRI